MKKKHVFIIGMILCITLIVTLSSGLILNYTPLKMDIYVNGELVETTCAYSYDRHLFLPIMGIMEIYGYQTSYVDERNPTFVIDGKTYQLDIDNCQILEGDNQYLGDYVGGRTFFEKNGELYTIVAEIDDFFAEIGKEPVAIARTDWKKWKVYIELEK